MNILRLEHGGLSFGEQRILQDTDFFLDEGERVALIGRNGTGKSTLLRVLNGDLVMDEGSLRHAGGLRIAYLDQSLPPPDQQTLFEVVTNGLTDVGITERASSDWNTDHRVTRMLHRLDLPGEKTMQECSGGIRRRAMLARAFVSDPDLLLLDEPTNHLDIPAIEALQQMLLEVRAAVVLVSHDRTLIDKLATRIVELDRGVLTSHPGTYAAYEARKAHLDDVEANANSKFDQMLAKEEKWIRQGIKARRTRNQGRLRRLQNLRKERAERIEKQGNVSFQLDAAERSGELVAALDDVTFGFEQTLVSHFSCRIMRGDRVAIVGTNGCGKSTLVRLILGELQADSGSITLGSRLQIAYFDQQRSALNELDTVRDNVSPGSDQIETGGKTRHVAGYLADFLFPPGILNMPAARLSGGEKNRLLMARLFAQPANVLVLDEPTNDLDVETLELFEEMLGNFNGTILLISHDRAFIDAVATNTLVFQDNGLIREYIGGYSDWQANQPGIPPWGTPSESTGPTARPYSKPDHRAERPKRLGYMARRELNALPEKIEAMEAEQQTLQEKVLAADFYQQQEQIVKETLTRLQTLSNDIETAYARWEELSALE